MLVVSQPTQLLMFQKEMVKFLYTLFIQVFCVPLLFSKIIWKYI